MSRSNWLSHPPIGVGIAVLLLFAGALLANNQRESGGAQRRADQYSQNSLHSVPNVSPPPVARQETLPREPKSERDERRQEEDLVAQKEMARWAWWMMLASFASVGVTGVGIWYVKQTLDTNRDAVEKSALMAELAERHMVASERPWLSVKLAVTGDLEFKNYEGRIEISFVMKNVGKSPAINVDVSHHIVTSLDKGWPKMKEIAAKARTSKRNHMLGHKIFPGDQFLSRISMPILRSDIEDQAVGWGLTVNDDFLVFPAVVGCVVYNSTLDKTNHITEFVAHLGTRSAVHPNTPLGIKIKDGKTSVADLLLVLSFGTGSAD
jgi:hypothetical protein